jgi:hypothetical protein
MLKSGALARQPELYAGAVRQTLQSLNTVDDATLVGLTRLGIDDVRDLKREVAEILPASNLPAFLLQGLVQLQDRALKPERVAADLSGHQTGRYLWRIPGSTGIGVAWLSETIGPGR